MTRLISDISDEEVRICCIWRKFHERNPPVHPSCLENYQRTRGISYLIKNLTSEYNTECATVKIYLYETTNIP